MGNLDNLLLLSYKKRVRFFISMGWFVLLRGGDGGVVQIINLVFFFKQCSSFWVLAGITLLLMLLFSVRLKMDLIGR